ncbi:NAD(P)-dependent alcohol dehydrogenase [Cyclobacterium jeungdonense]|uniref:NAD(P)-dependent alcohol dehydrogenase n=1 Tax=Cyclobacterium jeungdonense TaxID=708087 RepID=A0ABT8C9D7_9BACT|nr:NAD(P)-dependent alcohol dehydrogenase [Cyclobacterium jeungdonense]MDN3689120.1 NAD(P)-dependent alcohol dehydrogenase [Cyclobacterium jeungdonense]
MKAYLRTRYGGPEVLHLGRVAKPTVKKGHLLVRIAANSANPADWHILRGTPVLARLAFGVITPKNKLLGADFAGTVEEVGEDAGPFQVGDRVFGEDLKGGTFAEFAVVPATACAHMPEGSSFAAMASIPVAGLTALQGLLTHGKLQNGESLLINGASGGVGHLAVQIAKAFGARVTGVCSARNRDFVQSLGADEVIAYDKDNLQRHQGKYDLVFDTHGNLFYRDFTRMGKRGVVIGFTNMKHLALLMLQGALGKFPLAQFTAAANTQDLETLASLVKEGKISVHLEKTYSYRDIPKAITYIEAMRTRGKVAMIWEEG